MRWFILTLADLAIALALSWYMTIKLGMPMFSPKGTPVTLMFLLYGMVNDLKGSKQ